MSGSDYTHFSKLAFDSLFARKEAGQEVQVMDSNGNLNIAGITATSLTTTGNLSVTGTSALTGQATVSKGSAAAPGIRFSGATTSGLAFDNTSSSTSLVAGGNAGVKVAQSGDVSVPFNLAVTGTGTFTGKLVGKGTATNDNASAGQIGEVMSIDLAGTTSSYGASATYVNIGTVSLTAGDWEVNAIGQHFLSTASACTRVQFVISKFSANTTTDHATGDNQTINDHATNLPSLTAVIPGYRISTSATISVYFKAAATYTGTAPKYRGRATFRRMR